MPSSESQPVAAHLKSLVSLFSDLSQLSTTASQEVHTNESLRRKTLLEAKSALKNQPFLTLACTQLWLLPTGSELTFVFGMGPQADSQAVTFVGRCCGRRDSRRTPLSRPAHAAAMPPISRGTRSRSVLSALPGSTSSCRLEFSPHDTPCTKSTSPSARTFR